jgi:polyisoprenoid-binding protein YceI|tara:strand:+ start:662 stop:1378 length:717 start_codon:yes stop_codon:yes gene_type:complete
LKKRRIVLTTAALVIVIGAMAAYGVWRVISNAPDEVSLDAAVASLETSEVVGQDLSTEGTWVIDSDSGSFTFEEASGSFVGFRIKEELARIGKITAVGRTGEVDGELRIGAGELQSVSVSADLSTLITNDSRRDRAARNALNVSENPIASFSMDKPVALSATDGSAVSLKVKGELLINGIGREAEFDLQAQLVGETVVVVGSTEVVFADYDVEVPSAVIVVSAEDHGVVEFQLLFVRP